MEGQGHHGGHKEGRQPKRAEEGKDCVALTWGLILAPGLDLCFLNVNFHQPQNADLITEAYYIIFIVMKCLDSILGECRD
jgi:hypothetical protein